MNLDRLAHEVRRKQESNLDPARRRAVRDRLLSEEPATRPARAGTRWNVLLALLALGTALVVWVQWPQPEGPLTFAVAGEPGASEAFVSAPLSHSVPMTFSDGSHVQLERGSSARVNELHAHGATLRLEHGHADVRVVHRPITRWQVEAGPYVVHVIGTRFSVRWDARSEEFDVAMREGRVQVEGPDGFRMALEGRERLHRVGRPRVDRPRVVPDEPDVEPIAAEPIAAVEPVAVAEPIAVERPQATSAGRTGRGPPRSDWRQLARAGDYETAVERIDLEPMVRDGGADDLRLLATTLRRAGDSRESAVWRALRARFSDPDAAFHLARRAFHTGDLAESETWLRTYLRESPRGRWEMEARGRLLEVLSRRDTSEAGEAARRYLARFPDGPHARLARSWVESR